MAMSGMRPHGLDSRCAANDRIMTTSGCVRATAVDAFQYNFEVVIPFECVADRSQISHKVNLLDLHMKYADVASLDDVIAYLRAVKGAVPSSV